MTNQLDQDRANSIIIALTEQRDAANNAAADLRAQLLVAQAKIKQLEEQKAEPANDDELDLGDDKQLTNGAEAHA